MIKSQTTALPPFSAPGDIWQITHTQIYKGMIMKRGTSFVYLFRHFNLTPVRYLICTSALQLAPLLLHLPVWYSLLCLGPRRKPRLMLFCFVFTRIEVSLINRSITPDVQNKPIKRNGISIFQALIRFTYKFQDFQDMEIQFT